MNNQDFYMVAFVSKLKQQSKEYDLVASEMLLAVEKMPGFLGVRSVRDSERKGITLSFWKNKESIRVWKNHPPHIQAQKMGKSHWYENYEIFVGQMEDFK